MALLWRLSLITIPKQLPATAALSSRNPLLLNIIQRSSSKTQGTPLLKISRVTRKLQALDKVSSDCILIYRSPTANLVRICYYTSILFVTFSLYGIYLCCKKENNSEEKNDLKVIQLNSSFTMLQPDFKDSLMMWTVVFASNLLLAVWCRKHVPRVWFSPSMNKYIMCLHGNLPGHPNIIAFEPGSAKLKRKNPMTAIGRASHLINGRTYFFNEIHFRTPAEYEKVIGGVALE